MIFTVFFLETAAKRYMKNNFTTLLDLLTVVLSSCSGIRIATTIGPQIPLKTDITKI